MTKRIDYGGLRPLADVRKERIRVQKDIKGVQAGLNDDYGRFAQMLSLDYWIDFVAGKVQGFTPAIQAIWSGYRLVSSIFNKQNEDHETKKTTTKKRKTTTTRKRKKDIED